MKKLYMLAVLFIAAIFAAAASVNAGSVWKAEDAESPILIKYTGDDSTGAKVIVATNMISLIELANLHTNYVMMAGSTNTIAEVCGVINVRTGYNHTASSPVYPWKAIQWGGLSTDNLTNNVVGLSTNALLTKNVYDGVVKWDTSSSLALHYDAVVSGNVDGPLGGTYITSIFGDAAGTGSATVRIYEGDDVKYQRTYALSTNSYLVTEGATTNIAIPVISAGNIPAEGIDLGTGIRIGRGKVGLVRVTLTATATGGGIGATTREE